MDLAFQKAIRFDVTDHQRQNLIRDRSALAG